MLVACQIVLSYLVRVWAGESDAGIVRIAGNVFFFVGKERLVL